ncbi:sigma-70 family RNA polymerase sigma factor, partial [bacterium]|nr:sigma-70 family RNA polymerase sigma factor [bacterium]
MDYEEIGELIGNIKFHYVESGEWNSLMCGKLFNLTQHVPLMVGRKRGIDQDDLQDIVQQSYQAAFKYLNRLDDDRTFPRYLYTIADNLCRKYWQKRIKTGHKLRIEFSDGYPMTSKPSLEQFDQAVLREDLRDAV